MTVPQSSVLVIFAYVALVLCTLSIPLILRKVPRNNWYGFRTSKTLSKDEIWYPVNRLAGFDLLCAGILILATTGTFFLFPDLVSESCQVSLLLSVTLITVFGALAHTFYSLKKFKQ